MVCSKVAGAAGERGVGGVWQVKDWGCERSVQTQCSVACVCAGAVACRSSVRAAVVASKMPCGAPACA